MSPGTSLPSRPPGAPGGPGTGDGATAAVLDDPPGGPPPPAPAEVVTLRQPGSHRSHASERLLDLAPALERELLLLPRLIRPGSVCIDVGAGFGLYTLALSWLVGRTGLVHAFEPLPRAWRRLGALSRLLGRRNIRRHRIAVADRNASATLVEPRRLLPVPGRSFLADGALTRVLGPSLACTRELTVTTGRLDDRAELAERPIGLVKIDVEGTELDVLAGATALLLRDRPVILCEVEDRHLRRYGKATADVLAATAALGYEPFAYCGGRLVPYGSTRHPLRNVVFLPEGRSTSRW